MLVAVNFLSCGKDRRLVSITVQPTGFTFLTPSSTATAVFTAIGTYVHPPGTADISSKVVWKTDVPGLIKFSGSTVSLPSNAGCGIATVSASLNGGGNLVIAYATVTVNDPTISICPGGSSTQAVVLVALTGSGSGVVTSTPAGINCPGTCGAQFKVGDTILLTATPDPGDTVGVWTGCTTVTGNVCSLTVLAGSTTVTATFN